MLSLDRLRVLHAVATYGSVQSAAHALHVSPSAVSQQIAKLELEVDLVLVERNGRGVRLTDAASLLCERANEVLATMESIEGELDTFRSTVSGHIRISAFPTAARGLGPAMVRWLQSHHPSLHPVITEQEPDDAFVLLTQGEIDLVIAQDWDNSPLAIPRSLSRVALFDDVADIAISETHRFARRRFVRLVDLVSEDWITWPSGELCHEWLKHSMRSLGHEPRIVHTAAEHATQLAFVGAGLGLAVIPRLGRGAVPDGVRMVRTDPALHRHVFLAWRTNASRRTAIAAVREAATAVTVARRSS
jgi:DNA-binding transcriptional LysR family regulator